MTCAPHLLAPLALLALGPAAAYAQVELVADLATEEVTPETPNPMLTHEGAVLWSWLPFGYAPAGYVEQLVGADGEAVEPLLSLSRAQGRQVLSRVRDAAGPHLFLRRGLTDTSDTEQLFVTDGTRAGSHRLEDLDNVHYGLHTAEWSGATFVLLDEHVALHLGRLDPRTGAVDSLRRFPHATSDGFFIRDGALHFRISSGASNELFVTDGTAEGTRVAFDLGGSRISPSAFGHATLPSGAWILSGTTEATGTEPWIWDEAGPRPLVDLAPGAGGSVHGDPWVAHAGQVWFPDASGRLFRTDGTPEGTHRVTGVVFVQWLFEVGGRLSILDADRVWWVFDGEAFVDLGLRPVSVASIGAHAWVVEGGRGGTPRRFLHVDLQTLQADLLDGPIPTALYRLGDQVLAVLEPRPGGVPLASFGPEGPPLEPAGKLPVPVNASSFPGRARPLGEDAVLMEASLQTGAERVAARLAPGAPARIVDPAPAGQSWQGGLLSVEDGMLVWRGDLDGPAIEMVEAEAWREQIFVHEDVLLVLSLPRGPRPWMVRFDAPGAEPRRILPTDERDLYPVDVRPTDDGLVVYAVDSDFQQWLRPFGPDGFAGPWVQTEALSEPWSSPYGLYSTEVGDTRLVLSRLHPTREALGELAIGPGAVWGRAGQRFVVLHSGRFEALDLVTGERTTGTFDGKDPERLAELPDRLIFSARWRDTGREPWVFDADGPRLLQDILPGPASSFPEPGAVIDGQLVFSAVDLDFGREAFATDGASPPRLLFDLNPGPWDGIASGSDPAFSAVRAHVYFAGWDREVGVEPHRFPRALLTPDPEAECRQDTDCPAGARCVGGACVPLDPPAPGADAGVPPDGGATSLDGLEAGGCGCRGSARGRTTSAAWVALAALIVLARRRRQPH